MPPLGGSRAGNALCGWQLHAAGTWSEARGGALPGAAAESSHRQSSCWWSQLQRAQPTAPRPPSHLPPPALCVQDAHEFWIWLLNDIGEVLEKEERAAQAAARRASRDPSRASSRASSRATSPTKGRSPTKGAGAGTGAGAGAGRSPSLQLLSAAAAKAAAARNRPVRTWVHELFQVCCGVRLGARLGW